MAFNLNNPWSNPGTSYLPKTPTTAQKKSSILSNVLAKVSNSANTVGNAANNYFSNVGKGYAKAGQDIVSGIKEGASQMAPGLNAKTSLNPLTSAKNNLQVLRGAKTSALRTAGGVAGAALLPITETPVLKQGSALVNKGISSYLNNDPLGQTAGRVGNFAAGKGFVPSQNNMPLAASLVAKKAQQLAQRYPEQVKDLKNAMDIAMIVGLNKLEKGLTKKIKTSKDNSLLKKMQSDWESSLSPKERAKFWPDKTSSLEKTYQNTRDNITLEPSQLKSRLNDVGMKAQYRITGNPGTDSQIYKDILALADNGGIDSPGQFYQKISDLLKKKGLWNAANKEDLMGTMMDYKDKIVNFRNPNVLYSVVNEGSRSLPTNPISDPSKFIKGGY